MKQFKEIDDKWTNHLMVLAAFRYCLGRETYIVSECVNWLCEFWEDIQKPTQDRIISETMDALDADLAGDKPDKECWQSLLVFAGKKAAPHETATY